MSSLVSRSLRRASYLPSLLVQPSRLYATTTTGTPNASNTANPQSTDTSSSSVNRNAANRGSNDVDHASNAKPADIQSGGGKSEREQLSSDEATGAQEEVLRTGDESQQQKRKGVEKQGNRKMGVEDDQGLDDGKITR